MTCTSVSTTSGAQCRRAAGHAAFHTAGNELVGAGAEYWGALDPALITQVTPGATRSDPESPGAHGDESPASTRRTR